MEQSTFINAVVSEKTGAHRLTVSLNWLGRLNVVCFVVYGVFSYGLATVGPERAPLREIFLNFAQAFGSLGQGLQTFFGGESLAKQEAWLLAYCGPIVVSSVVFLLVLMLLGRNHEHIDIGTPKILFTWAVIFACVSILACPTLVQDFWLSLAWGRMVGEGINPYHSNVTPEILQGLPLTEVSIRMTYGPLWALISGVVMLCTGGHWLLGALIFKLLLGGAWVGCLWLTWVLLRQHSPWHQCVGIAVFGWLPLSVIQTVADGHNDVFMVFFLLLWLYFLDKGRPVWASLSLTASALVKYITAPLFLLDILHLRYSRKQKLSAYIPQLAAAAALSLIVFGVFYRSPDFFDSTTEMRNWLFFRPSDAVTAIERLTGIKIWYGARLVRALFPIFAIYFIIAYVRKPQRDNFVKAILATVSAVLFSAVGHVWPWFVLWAVAVAGLVPGSALARWVLGVGLAAPFPLLVWVVFPDASDRMKFDVPALVLYTFTLLWFVFVPKSWFPKYAEFKTSQAAQYNGSGAA